MNPVRARSRSNHRAGLLLCLALGCARTDPVPAGPVPIPELSGLAQSRVHPGIAWGHGDSGNPATLHAFDRRGDIVASFDLPGASNVDWEDITADDRGNLFIADTGNNFGGRRDLVVYQVREPTELPRGTTAALPVVARIPFHYPDQTDFTPRSRHNHDAEALVWSQGTLWIATKHRLDHRTELYRFPPEAIHSPGTEVELQHMGGFEVGGHGPLGGMVTAADISPDGRWLGIITYHHGFIFDLSRAPLPGLDAPMRIELPKRAIRRPEAAAWWDGALVVANEQGLFAPVWRPSDTRPPR